MSGMKGAREKPRLADPERCTGCSACAASCRFDALVMTPDDEGFLRPSVDTNRCVGCGACSVFCPELSPASRSDTPIEVLACWDGDDARRISATSGGVFMLLADAILKRGGWVCGAVLDDAFDVRHVVTRDRSVVEAMRGSKYVQSDVAEALVECTGRLRAGECVLFSGTPCQVAAMRRLAQKVLTGELVAVDILCHGAPSPLFWQEYLRYREKRAGAKTVGVCFRKKEPSWTLFSMELCFRDGSVKSWPTTDDLYLRAFLGDFISRSSCYECPYVGVRRVGDLTLADFWGYVSESHRYRNDERGISLVLVNTQQGASVLAAVRGIVVVQKELREAVKGNVPLRSSFKANSRRKEFWSAFRGGGVEAVASDYLGPRHASLKHRASLFFNDHAYLVPTSIRRLLIGIRSGSKGLSENDGKGRC